MPQTLEQLKEIIRAGNLDVTSKVIKSLVDEHREGRGGIEQRLYQRYRQEQEAIPILGRKVANYEKVNIELANDFYADIVDTKQGYMGNEVTIELDKEPYKTETAEGEESVSAKYEEHSDFLLDFGIVNSTEDLNSEAVKQAACMGRGARLLYVDVNGKSRVMNINPWSVIEIWDRSLAELQLALRYYNMSEVQYGEDGDDYTTDLTAVEVYDKQQITYYISDGQGNYVLDRTKPMNPQPHMFAGVPIVIFKNNDEEMAEPEKAVSLIDAYDAILSDTATEIEQLRLAYLFAKSMGMKLDDKFLETLRQTGIFPLPPEGEVGFINKAINDQVIVNALDEIRRNIYQFSRSIDLSKDMGGDMRVIGWQVNLLNLENSCKVTERKFTRALREQYRMLTTFWKEQENVDINYLDLHFVFTRNFPKDIANEAKTLLDLLGTVSRKTAYAQMSFIDDVDAEVEAYEAEQEGSVDLDGIFGGQNEQESAGEGEEEQPAVGERVRQEQGAAT